jgi:bacterioferritin (cytochrome b1)
MNAKIKMAEYLNEQLSGENASANRLVTRIHEASIPVLKQRLNQYLTKTMDPQEKLFQFITDLGGKPTESKANLPTMRLSHRDTIKETIEDKMKSLSIENDTQNAKKAENELERLKEDFTISSAASISYRILLYLAYHDNVSRRNTHTRTRFTRTLFHVRLD